jgi:hypothetical protein
MTKHRLTFERTTHERITIEADNEGLTERAVVGWAQFGGLGRSPLDGDEYKSAERIKNSSPWKLVSAEPPLATEQKTKRKPRPAGL